ncbi:major facilitator superfamily domain-containing protein [Morchella snyderi]|nr:major facilitator superfamily domain-containing protein [Morchella snyderi]
MTDSSTLAPSTFDNLNEKSLSNSRAVSPTDGEKMDDIEVEDRAKEGEKDNGEFTEDGQNYPGPVALGLITMALCLAVFLVALDQTIIATAIPKITDQFGALDDVGWYGSGYMLTMCSFQLIYGKLYSYFSLKWCFLAAIGIFELGSLICGAAPTSEALIVGRAIAGLGCAGIFSGALIILAHSVPLRKRPMYSGLIGAMFGIASVAGPLMGGAFTDHLTWRWCFYINLPIGAVVMIAIIVFFTPPNRVKADKLTGMEKLKELDLAGTAVLLPGIVCLLLALQWGGSKYQWSNPKIIGLLVTAGVLLAAFVGVQAWRGEKATIPPRILRQRSILSSCIVSFSIGSCFMLLVFYLPIWFQAIKGVTATQSGIRNLPLILGVTICSILSGVGTTVFGYYTPFMYVGAVMSAVGAGLLTTFEVDTASPMWIGYQVLCGAGIGLVMQQPMIAAQTVLKLEDVPTGTSCVIFFQTLGGALFISVGQNVFTSKLIEGLTASMPDFDPAIVLSTGATSLQSMFSPDQLPMILQAYNDALTQCFYPSVAMACLGFLGSLGMEWVSVKGKKIEMGMAA